jgi:hypothetical protein
VLCRCALRVQEANGMIIVPVMSNPTGAWNGKKGYVQAVLKEDGVRVPRNTGPLKLIQYSSTSSSSDKAQVAFSTSISCAVL